MLEKKIMFFMLVVSALCVLLCIVMLLDMRQYLLTAMCCVSLALIVKEICNELKRLDDNG